ncbi:hypothetical protein EDB80DRAFT_437662 [Ilyonectria destructans]|nr:hypothetical protein EDB80DRAFT_437662 [Ilyonectria destructans]
MVKQAKIPSPSPRSTSRRTSEDKPSLQNVPEEQATTPNTHSPQTDRRGSERISWKMHLPPQTKQKGSERTSWKKQLKFRSFMGKRSSASSRDSRIRDLKIVHLTDQPVKPLMQIMKEDREERQRAEECRVSTMTFGMSFNPSDLVEPEEVGNLDDDDEYSDGLAESIDELDLEENDPFHLENRISATITEVTELNLDAVNPGYRINRTMSMSRMSESSSDESRPCSPLPFIQEADSASDQEENNNSFNINNISNDIINDNSSDVSPRGSPRTDDNHISWNWAEPAQSLAGLALAPAPAPKSTTAWRPASNVASKPPPTASALRANMVQLRRPSRPDNPWSWKLPAPDPAAPKINTVIVRRPSRMDNPWTYKSPGHTPTPSLKGSVNSMTRRGSRSDDLSSNASSRRGSHDSDQSQSPGMNRNFPRRPSRGDDPWIRPLHPSPLSKESQLKKDARRPSPEDALNSHPVNLRQDSLADPVHVRQDSVSDPMCRMCHIGVAEAWGVCQRCDDETSPGPTPHHQGFSTQQVEKDKRAQGKNNRPPPIVTDKTSPFHRHQPTVSMTSNPEANEMTPPISPTSSQLSPTAITSRTIHTVVTIPPHISGTSLSALPTPEVLARYQYGVPTAGGKVLAQGRPLSNDELADYYFDKNSESKFRDRNDSVVNREAQGYMTRDVSLEEYDGFWGSPMSPGPGWI